MASNGHDDSMQISQRRHHQQFILLQLNSL